MTDWNRIFPDGDHRWTMGLRPADAAAFFAPTERHEAVLAERARWLADEPAKYAALLPVAEPAVAETVAWLRSLGVSIDVAPMTEPSATLLALGRAVEPDLIWMHPSDDDVHRLAGGMLCFPSSWALADKLGRPMREVHARVPGLDAALGRQIDAFLAKLEPGAAWTRENWSIAADAELNHHTSRPPTPFPAALTPDDVWLRLEHQLLVKLPTSRSVLFAIRVEPVPLRTILADPPIAARLARLLATMHPDALAYKRLTTAGPAIVAMLRDAAQRRVGK